ncbi:MAG: hypothetical protein ABIG89_04545 [Candidatus Woesearchaeota archaeon]
MDYELRKKVKDYITKEFNKGFTVNAIEKVLLDRGYKKEEIDEIINEIVHEPLSTRLRKGVPFIIISIALIIAVILFIVFYAAPAGFEKCDTEICFINKANECKESLYEADDGSTIYEFKSYRDCTLQKTITKVSDTEPLLIKEMFNKKSLKCEYTKGNFDDRWMSTLLGGLDKCSGPLKEALYELTITQYREGVVE